MTNSYIVKLGLTGDPSSSPADYVLLLKDQKNISLALMGLISKTISQIKKDKVTLLGPDEIYNSPYVTCYKYVYKLDDNIFIKSIEEINSDIFDLSALNLIAIEPFEGNDAHDVFTHLNKSEDEEFQKLNNDIEIYINKVKNDNFLGLIDGLDIEYHSNNKNSFSLSIYGIILEPRLDLNLDINMEYNNGMATIKNAVIICSEICITNISRIEKSISNIFNSGKKFNNITFTF